MDSLNSKIIQKHYEQLFPSISKFIDCPGLEILIDDWPDYRDIRVVVIGSSPAKYFWSTGAFVGESVNGDVPDSVVNFDDALSKAFRINGQVNVDLHAQHSKFQHGILFINVCLCVKYTQYSYEIGDKYAPGVIEFINELMLKKHRENEKIGILDMRLDKHCHVSEKQMCYDQDYRELFGDYLIRHKSKHEYFRIGHPMNFNDNWDYAIEKLRIMSTRNYFPEIKSIYQIDYNCMP